jgi:hypothetical protein
MLQHGVNVAKMGTHDDIKIWIGSIGDQKQQICKDLMQLSLNQWWDELYTEFLLNYLIQFNKNTDTNLQYERVAQEWALPATKRIIRARVRIAISYGISHSGKI